MKPFSPLWLITVTLTAMLIYLMWLMVQPFISTLLWAVVLTIIANPIHRRFRAWRWSPSVSAIATLLLIIVLVVIPLFFIGREAVGQAASAIQPVQDGLRDLLKEDSRLSRWLAHYPKAKQILDPAQIAERMHSISSALAAQSFGFLGGVIMTIAQVGIVLFTSFYMLRDREALMSGIKRFLPISDAQSENIFQATLGVTTAILRGTLIVAAVQGALGGVTFWALGLTAPLLWGVLMFITAMVPLVGSALIWVPAVLYLLLIGSVTKAVILLAVGAGVIAMMDNLLRPVLIGARTRMHELVIFFAILGGIQVFGALGIIMGPVIVALTVAFLLIFYQLGDDQLSAEKAQELLRAIAHKGVSSSAMGPHPGTNSLTGSAEIPVGPTCDNEHVDEHSEGQRERNHP